MRVIADWEKLQRRAKRSQAVSLAGMLILLGSVGLSLWKPNLSVISTITLFVGFAVATVGIYYANRWFKKPRPEDTLDAALKGLTHQHRLYHYVLPCDHVLLTPSGVVVLETVNLEGEFRYQGGRWRQKFSPGRAMRFFVEERLGNPIERAQECAQAMQTILAHKLPDGARVPVDGAVVFVHPAAYLTVEEAPIPVCLPKKLRKQLPPRAEKLAPDLYAQVQTVLDEMAGPISKVGEEG